MAKGEEEGRAEKSSAREKMARIVRQGEASIRIDALAVVIGAVVGGVWMGGIRESQEKN